MNRGEGLEVEDRGLRVEVQQMVDTWDIEAQRRRTGARALVTVFSDARALLESVIEDELVGNRTHASLAEVQGAGPEQGLCSRACILPWAKKHRQRERERVDSST